MSKKPKKLNTSLSILNFEEALKDLTNIVETMERGDLSLEKALEYFEKGIVLTRQCQNALAAAEQKVQLLTAQMGEMTLTSFETTSTETESDDDKLDT